MVKEQLQVLNALDQAKTQLYRFTAIVIAGMCFFTDAYDLFCVSLVTKLLGRIYYHVDGSPKPGSLPPNATFGPNATTFIVPAKIIPARLRSTYHGISAATGKAGAIIGAFGFLYAAQSRDKTKTDAGYPPGIGIKYSLIVLGIINFLPMLFTFLVPEPSCKSLEELSGENDGEDETPKIMV